MPPVDPGSTATARRRHSRSLSPTRVRSAAVVGLTLAVAAVTAGCSSDLPHGSSTFGPDASVASGSGQLGADPGQSSSASAGIQNYRIQVVKSYPHDTSSWTEGLEFYQGKLLESTGRTGQSSLRLTDPTTGQPESVVQVAKSLYAEGVTVVNGQALQLTWKDRTLLSTPLAQLTPKAVTSRTDAYNGEGWGLCNDGTELVMSDGSDTLQFRDPTTFALLRTVAVTRGGSPLAKLNELECVKGQVWANVWLTTDIVAIDPATGVVTGLVDASSLVPDGIGRNDSNKVLNGIAYNPETQRFWLTGKLWPVVYEVELQPVAP